MGLKKFLQSVDEAKRIALDTMCFIYQYEERPFSFWKITNKLFTLIETKKKKAFTSIVTLSEILSKKEVWRDPNLRDKTIRAFSGIPFLTVCEVNEQVAILAPYYRVEYGLKLPDALQMATAVLNQCDLFITNDDSFKKVKEVKTLVLSDFIREKVE